MRERTVHPKKGVVSRHRKYQDEILRSQDQGHAFYYDTRNTRRPKFRNEFNSKKLNLTSANDESGLDDLMEFIPGQNSNFSNLWKNEARTYIPKDENGHIALPDSLKEMKLLLPLWRSDDAVAPTDFVLRHKVECRQKFYNQDMITALSKTIQSIIRSGYAYLWNSKRRSYADKV